MAQCDYGKQVQSIDHLPLLQSDVADWRCGGGVDDDVGTLSAAYVGACLLVTAGTLQVYLCITQRCLEQGPFAWPDREAQVCWS
jgi:hypothetical protein